MLTVQNNWNRNGPRASVSY